MLWNPLQRKGQSIASCIFYHWETSTILGRLLLLPPYTMFGDVILTYLLDRNLTLTVPKYLQWRMYNAFNPWYHLSTDTHHHVWFLVTTFLCDYEYYEYALIPTCKSLMFGGILRKHMRIICFFSVPCQNMTNHKADSCFVYLGAPTLWSHSHSCYLFDFAACLLLLGFLILGALFGGQLAPMIRTSSLLSSHHFFSLPFSFVQGEDINYWGTGVGWRTHFSNSQND